MAAFAAVDVAGATDSETQAEMAHVPSPPVAAMKHRLLVGALSAVGFVAAVSLAVSMSTAGPGATWSALDTLSKSTHNIEPDTGCSDWEAQMAIPMTTATSDLDCLNKCLPIAGAKYANYQGDTCDNSANGAEKGACYCFKGCAMVKNTCWDLINVEVSAATPAPTSPGATPAPTKPGATPAPAPATPAPGAATTTTTTTTAVR